MRGAAAVLLAVSAIACRETPPASTGAMGGGVVARVGSDTIDATLVGAVAAAQGLAPREALRHLVDDALAAAGARDRKLDATHGVRFQHDAALARIVLQRLQEEARAAGPITAAELEELSERRWREVDLPEQSRVVHAVVLRKASTREDDGRALAAAIAAAVAQAHDGADFLQRARAVPSGKLQIQAEELPAFGPDGRMSEGSGDLDGDFARAAFRLRSPGETSPVVESRYGWHVIRLVDRLPGKHVPPADRPALFAEDLAHLRARNGLVGALEAARKRVRVEPDPAAETLMAGVVRGATGPGSR